MFEIRVIGERELRKKFAHLAGATQRKIVRPAMARAIVPVNKAAKRNAPVETGLLKKSLGIKLKTYGRRGIVWACVGPRYGFAGVGPDGRLRDPVKYAERVEMGHGSWNVSFGQMTFLLVPPTLK